MKRLLTLILLSISTLSLAQYKSFDKIDDYKNTRNIQFQASLYKQWMVSDGITKNFLRRNIYLMTHVRQDLTTGEITTLLTLDLKSKDGLCSSPGKEVVITLANGEVIELIQTSEIQCGTSIHTSYPLTESQLLRMSKYDFEHIRVYMNDALTDREIKKKLKPVIKKTMENTIKQLEELKNPQENIGKKKRVKKRQKNRTTKTVQGIEPHKHI